MSGDSGGNTDGPLTRALMSSQGYIRAPPAKLPPFIAAAEVYATFVEASARLMRYARISFEALNDYKKRGISEFLPIADRMKEAIETLLPIVNRKMDVDFLEEEGV